MTGPLGKPYEALVTFSMLGTGLLSMMSLHAMSETTSCSQDHPKEGLVTACEAYLPMVKLARKVLRLNGMEGRIRLIHKRSDELQIGSDLPYCADILTYLEKI